MRFLSVRSVSYTHLIFVVIPAEIGHRKPRAKLKFREMTAVRFLDFVKKRIKILDLALQFFQRRLLSAGEKLDALQTDQGIILILIDDSFNFPWVHAKLISACQAKEHICLLYTSSLSFS